jgi:predicted transposase YdaD
MEIVTSWMEQGIQRGLQQGLQQGRQQGRQQGELALVMRQLTRRLGAVAPQLRERIGMLSIEQLEDLGEALLDFTNISDLEAWLGRQ